MSIGISLTKKNAASVIKKLQPLNRLLADAAFRMKYRVIAYPELNMFRVSGKGKTRLVLGVCTPINNFASARVVDNKYATNKLLEEAGIPVSKSVRVSRDKFYSGDWSLEDLEYPLVVKPLRDSLKGKGVLTNLGSRRIVEKSLKRAFQTRKNMLIEEYQKGLEDFRVLVVDGKVVAALHRVRPYVVGDGKRTIKRLIEEKNTVRKASKKIKLGLIVPDIELKNTLRSQGLRLSSVPRAGKKVTLKNVCNLGNGGEVHDVTDEISEENKKLAVKVAKVLDLRLAGLDFLCEDISKSLKKTGGVIIEVNEHPDIAMHHFPQVGESRDVALAIMKAFFK